MGMMIEEMLEYLYDEEEDFYKYLKMSEEVSDPTVKTNLRDIAEQEMHHFHILYDMLFGKDMEHADEFKRAMQMKSEDDYKKMEMCLQKKRG